MFILLLFFISNLYLLLPVFYRPCLLTPHFISFYFHFISLRSEVIYANKKVNSTTFQRFHCLTLEAASTKIPPSSAAKSAESKLKSSNFPPLKMGAKKVPEIVPVIEVEKMSIYAALEKYFQTEVIFISLALALSLSLPLHRNFLISPSLTLYLSFSLPSLSFSTCFHIQSLNIKSSHTFLLLFSLSS
jgi:hypothetical protein